MAESGDGDDDDKVGKGRPPRLTRFKRGQSGNPKGRPTGAKNMSTVLHEEMNARIRVTENGRPKDMTKREALAKGLVNKAVGGDPKATAVVIAEERFNSSRKAEPRDDALQTANDVKTIENLLQRVRATIAEESSMEANAPETHAAPSDPMQPTTDEQGPEPKEDHDDKP